MRLYGLLVSLAPAIACVLLMLCVEFGARVLNVVGKVIQTEEAAEVASETFVHISTLGIAVGIFLIHVSDKSVPEWVKTEYAKYFFGGVWFMLFITCSYAAKRLAGRRRRLELGRHLQDPTRRGNVAK